MNSQKVSAGKVASKPVEQTPSPRELMRARHPDLFSDSVVESRPVLARPVFEHHLETLTARKEEYQFEHFCRLIAEKEICPNLRIQTGPTGGGDSKVDSENYPVAKEISERWWVGESAGGSERWAFAFSAKKKWKPKLQADVESVLSTNRDYKRIYFFTNQLVSDKVRASTEDALTKTAGIPIHIVDRNWLADRVYRHGHLGLAISALQIEGASDQGSLRLGPEDTRRSAELKELDAQISDPGRYEGARYQLVEDCVRAANLARALDRPRVEIEGRLAMADRIARELGIPSQLLRVAYQRAWTAHWWFEDFNEFLTHYDEVERHATGSADADDQERLLTLNQLLITLERRNLVPADRSRATERRQALVAHLQTLEADEARPNNALFARMLRTFVNLTDAMFAENPQLLLAVWADLKEIAEASKYLGQFPFDSLSRMVHEMSELFDTPEFDSLYELVVDVERQRVSDGEAGESFRSRGRQKLRNEKPYEAIRWLGRAEELFVKEEFRRQLVLTLLDSSYAYESAGLLWAARNKLIVAIECAFRIFQIEGEMPRIAHHCFRRLTWIEMQLGRIPQILQAIVWTRFCEGLLTSTGRGESQSEQETMLLQAVLGIHFLNVPFSRISALEPLPDALARLGLEMPRLAVLYALGHEKRVNEECFADAPKNPKDMLDFFERWQDQPASEDLPSEPSLSEGAHAMVRSIILGAEFVVDCPNDAVSISVAESLLGAMEAFMATSDENDVFPHAEKTVIRVRKVKEHAIGPSFVWLDNVAGVHAEIVTGESVDFQNKEALTKFSDFLCETTLTVVAHRFIIRDTEAWMKKIAEEERGLARAAMLGNVVAIGRNLFGGDAKVRLSDWVDENDKHYDCLRDQHWRPNRSVSKPDVSKEPIKLGSGPPPEELMDTSQRKHTQRKVFSPIDIPAWDKAGWGGTCYGWDGRQPPFMALMFKNLEAGKKIFTDWHARWGREDVEDALRITIVTGISKSNPHHYGVIVGPNIDQVTADMRNGDTFNMVSRINRMTPATPNNLTYFLKAFSTFDAFFLMPAQLPSGSQRAPEVEFKLALLKRHLHIRPAWQIGENDHDIVALDDDEDPFIPDDVVDAPVIKAIASRRARKNGRMR
ncbi:hypothetical protein SAMN05216578_101152 [Halopseudomonas formosensis]|uniref:Uncharacterized protein n=1 Tax=Halopseudomonas formosensis TaxID=1002526 RepID=A0A1I5ZN54_9GAMM|nr:hypothetical protein [Halopseudomonas formosensis]SFQ57773.1 hypothetical protein SAMN05216578_101152 [Halopseudomonas formosensis]